MRVKRYVVDEMPEALAKIRQDLGKDAMILSTKRIKTRGFLGLFAKTSFEVIAAAVVDEKQAVASQGSTQKKDLVPLLEQKGSPNLVKQGGGKQQPLGIGEPGKSSTNQQQMQVLDEIQQIRSMFQSFLISEPEKMPSAMQGIQKNLLDNGVEGSLALQLIHEGMQQLKDIQPISEEELQQVIRNRIMEEMSGFLTPSPIAQGSQVVSILGPTGVGKTTTIAKLAANLVIREGKQVGLITTDTYRIAAVDQLKTYADILNVPLEIVYSPDDCRQAVKKLSEKDLILIDTAGRNFTHSKYIEELQGFLQAAKPDETYLVLSLTTKPSDLERIVNNFKDISIDRLLLTKLDETSTYGAIYNLVHKFQIPLSYITIGQNVPDDIETLTPELIAKLVVGEKHYV